MKAKDQKWKEVDKWILVIDKKGIWNISTKHIKQFSVKTKQEEMQKKRRKEEHIEKYLNGVNLLGIKKETNKYHGRV